MRQRADGSGTADQRREQMLRAALEIIAERGFPDTRIADVAERARASPALVIYYFKTKDQLLTEAMRYSEDNWYEAGIARLNSIGTAAGRLEELVAMICLPEADVTPNESWLPTLDLWAQAGRHPEVASVRQKFDERWRETISTMVVEGQEAGEFGPIDQAAFAVTLSALLDGFVILIALGDPTVDGRRAFELTMRFVADELGFSWVPRRRAGQGGAAEYPAGKAAREQHAGGSAAGR